MRRLLMAGLAVTALAFTPALRAFEPPETQAKAKDKAKPTPREQFQAVLDEYNKATRDFFEVYQKARTNEERSKLVQEKYPNPATYAGRFLAIAEANPDDPVAVDALVQAAQLGRGSGPGSESMERLVLKFASNPKIGRLSEVLVYSPAPWAEKALRAIAENPDRTTRGQATLALAQYLNRTKEGATGSGRQAQIEALFEKVVKDYGDVAHGRGTLGDVAKGELNEIRNLGIGKPCPEIAGDDLEGKPFKLSDYRGKVVVVDFWGDW